MQTTTRKNIEKATVRKGGTSAGSQPAGSYTGIAKAKKKPVKRTAANKPLWVKNEKGLTLEGKFDDITSRLPVIVRIAMKGVKTDIFYKFANLVEMPDKFLADILNISTRTLSNYKDQKKTLEPVKGEHLLKLIALFKKGEEVFGTLHEFQGWLQKPLLNKKEKPIDCLVTPGGVDLVSLELDRIAHGYAL